MLYFSTFMSLLTQETFAGDRDGSPLSPVDAVKAASAISVSPHIALYHILMATPLEPSGGHNNLIPEVHDQQEDSINVATEWINSIVLPVALWSSAQLGVFDIIAKAGEGAKLSAKDIATQIGTNNPDAPNMLDRLLRLLVSTLC